MRDIKFRVWNTLLKGYVPEDIVYLSPDGSLLFGSIMLDSAIYIKPNFQKYKDVILEGENIVEQSTGLKDKNGTEIYEGDVVKVEGDGEIYRVEWIYSGFGLEPRYNSPRYPILGNVKLRKKIEVIGNIHENSELLEEK